MKRLILFFPIFLFVFFILGCTAEEIASKLWPQEEIIAEKAYIYLEEDLIKRKVDPARDFYWDYYLFIPSALSKDRPLYLLVNFTDTPSWELDDKDDSEQMEIHERHAYNDVYASWKNQIARELNVPFLVPVFPWPIPNYWLRTHALNREAMLNREKSLARPDLQLIAMIRDAQEILAEAGFDVQEKILMNGIHHSSGFFANRFTIIHPYMVKAVAFGNISAMPTLPIEYWEGERLRYPVGIADIRRIAGHGFDSEEYSRVRQYIYIGTKGMISDIDDAVKDGYSFDKTEAKLIERLFGKDVMIRWQKIEQVNKELGIPATFVVYESFGYWDFDVSYKITEDITNFFKEVIEMQ